MLRDGACTNNKDTQLLSRVKGCFIPAKSQSSPNQHNSGLGFISDLSVLHPDTYFTGSC